MTTVTIYRYERDGKGPYQADWPHKIELAMAHCDFFHPSPTSFGEPWCSVIDQGVSPEDLRRERCGLTSREALDEWFCGWHERLLEAGFQVIQYVVGDEFVRHGRAQVTFVSDGLPLGQPQPSKWRW